MARKDKNTDNQEQEVNATPQVEVQEQDGGVVVQAGEATVTVEVAEAAPADAPATTRASRRKIEDMGPEELAAYLAERKAKNNEAYRKYKAKLDADPERKAKYDEMKRKASKKHQAKVKALLAKAKELGIGEPTSEPQA